MGEGRPKEPMDTMASKYWIKLYHEILEDDKMGTLPDNLWRRAIELFLFAGETGNDGNLPDTARIAWKLRLPPGTLQSELEQLEAVGILTQTETGWIVTNFEKRQSPSEAKERVKQYRDRKRRERQESNAPVTIYNEESNGNVTESNACNAPDTESDTDTDSLPKGSGDKSPEPSAGKPAKAKRKPARPPTETEQASREMFKALADLCQFDLEVISKELRGALNQTEKVLRNKGSTPAALKEFGAWWYEHDWRGKQGQPPRPNQVRETWGQFENRHTARQNGHHKTNITGLRPTEEITKRVNIKTGETYYVNRQGDRVPAPADT